MPPAPTLVLDTLEKVRKLRNAVVNAEDETVVLPTAKALLDAPAGLNEELQQSITRIYADALIQKGDFERLVELCRQENKAARTTLVAIHPYALYRMERYEEAHKLANQALADKNNTNLLPVDREALQHLVAQCDYRLGNLTAAQKALASLYETAADANDNDDAASIATNLVAAHVSNATPYVATSLENQSSLIQNDAASYDLKYNLATLQTLASPDTQGLLQQALAQAESELDGNEDSTCRELAPLRWNVEWARVFWQGGSMDGAVPMKDLPAAGKLVALVNRALSMPKPTDGLRLLPNDTSKFTPLQARLLWYNRAILQYKAQQWDECMETSRRLQSTVKEYKPATKIEGQWWEVRATVLQVRAQLQKGGKYNKNTAEQTLQGLLQTLEKQPASVIRDDAMAYIQCQLPNILGQSITSNQARLDLLQSLPESWQSKPGVVATMAALYQQEGQSAKAMELVQKTGHEDALADLLLSQGLYGEAVEMYEKADLTDPIAQARYARALTYSDKDPSKALSYWKEVRPSDVLDGPNNITVDGAALETKPVPRLRTSSPRRAVDVGSGDGNNHDNSKKKSHEAVLRRRARKREAYLATLDQRGLRRTEHPDPERWLPKYERSYNRRRRNKNAHKGAQGGVSDKDAAQLDVAARQAARAAGDVASSTSTAHIAAVSTGGPRKGGRRR